MADFSVSRATVREAIRILEFEGLITLHQGMRGGARVNAVTPDLLVRATGTLLQARGGTIGQVYQARMLIEPPAARLSAETRPKQAAQALRAQLEREYEVVDDYDKLSVALADFHRTLLEQCGNVALTLVGYALHDVVQRHLKLAQRLKPSDQERYLKLAKNGLQEHQKLIDFIASGDGAAAEAYWAQVMKATSGYWLAGLAATSVIDILE